MLWILAQACTLGLDPTDYSGDELVLAGIPMETSEPSQEEDISPQGDEGPDSDSEPEQPPEDQTDLDGDGYGVDDCDDEDPEVHPNQFDDCDSIDSDCDGEVDEDALWDEDPSSPILLLGEVFNGDVIQLDGLLFPEFDKDVYEFEIYDGLFGWFFIDALAESASQNTDITLSLIQLDEATGSSYEFVFEVDDQGVGEGEFLSYDGRPMWDDSGTYQLEISSLYGSDCELPYSITLEVGT